MSQVVAQKRARLQTILAERVAWASQLLQVKRMHGWVLSADHLLDGSWAEPGEVVSNAMVASQMSAWREQMAKLLTEGTLSELEGECRSRVLTGALQPAPVLGAVLRPQGLSAHRTPRWSAAFAASKRSIAASVVARTGTRIWCATGALWPTPLGGSKMPPIASSSSSELVSLTVPGFRQLRRETTTAHSEQLRRFRFRHKRAAYLASLEERWAVAAPTLLLP